MPNISRPNLVGFAHDRVVKAFRQTFELLDRLLAEVESLKTTYQQVRERTINYREVARQLQAGGQAPLNVEGLLGRLAQPQTGGAPTRSAHPSFTDPLVQDGALYVLAGSPNVLYRVNGTTEPPTLDPIGGSGSVVQVDTGNGLQGGPITTTGTIEVTDEVVQSANSKVPGSPVTDGYIECTINGVAVKLMTTA
jgi:hypothetical protein